MSYGLCYLPIVFIYSFIHLTNYICHKKINKEGLVRQVNVNALLLTFSLPSQSLVLPNHLLKAFNPTSFQFSFIADPFFFVILVLVFAPEAMLSQRLKRPLVLKPTRLRNLAIILELFLKPCRESWYWTLALKPCLWNLAVKSCLESLP